MLVGFSIRSRCLFSTLTETNNQLKQLNAKKQYEKVIDLFGKYTKKNLSDDTTINQMLKACVELGDTKRGLDIYQRLSSQSKENHLIQTNLIRLFMNSGDLTKAREIFNQSRNTTIVMYNAMFHGLSNNQEGKQAIDLFQQMSIEPNEYTYTILFKTCSKLTDQKSMYFGKDLLKTLPNQYRNHTIILNSALHMLMQHGEVDLAEKCFSQMAKDATSYGVMMSGYVKNKRIQDAMDLFARIKNPNDVIYIVFFNACSQAANFKALDVGKRVFFQLWTKSNGKISNEKLLHAALAMFAKCSDVENAEKLFARLHRNQMTYGSMMVMYNQRNQPRKTLLLFEQMKMEKIEPNEQIFILILNALFQLHDSIRAKEFFDQISKKSSMVYDVMLNGLASHNRAEEAFNLFRSMSISPSEYSLSILFKICSRLNDRQSIEFAKSIFQEMPKKYRENTVIINSALHMFMQHRQVSLAEKIFSQMNKDAISYGVMMSGYLTNNQPEQVIDMFLKLNDQTDEVNMLLFFGACAELDNEKGLKVGKQIFSQISSRQPSEKVLHAVLNMFAKCSDTTNAESLFSKLKKNALSYGCMMTMYNNQNEPDRTLSLYEEMKREKIELDHLNWVLILNALADLSDLSTCESVTSELLEKFSNDIQIQNALIHMWGKASSADRARDVFEQISEPTNMSYSAMINAYDLNGLGREAVQLYRQIPEEIIDDIINLCVLNACSHSSLINEAEEIFRNIPIEKRTEKIYSTMIHCYNRSNLVNKAEELLSQYEESHSPCYSMYMSFLSAARNQRNPLLAQKMFDRIEPYLKDQNIYATSAQVLLAHTYALAGDSATASTIRIKMNQSGLKKLGGLSWTVVNGKKFRAHDRSHKQSNQIYAELERLTNELKEHGYQCDASWISRPMMNDETGESVLSGHSERLAIAYNLIQRPIPKRIQIMENLRVCGDCHTFTKWVAQVRQCTIIICDANRTHHFHPDGHCSCGDFF
ncbi:unnamed protein product [Adineta ricciae]|uniref:DYW domain-containing protein n=1 Tax=Adineta ricciae TaxID=249248 RepID=A0A815ZTE1_ADIRI|nr:unnamed protein product [Adineta ricciae]